MSDDKYAQSKVYDPIASRGLTGKRDYVRGLEQRSDAEALSLLVECLCDESWYLRDLAEEALERIGERAAPVLVPLLEQGLWFTRTSAARVLGHYTHVEAVEPLLRLTEDANETVVDAARAALVDIGRGGGALSIARALHRLPSDLRRRRSQELADRDRALGERIDQMLRNDELMAAGADSRTGDPRANEDHLEWEVVTGSSRREAPSGHGGGDAGSR
jgi:HEAT repeat protein